MYTRTMCLSKKRIINHIKRYWWVLMIFFMIGLAGGIYGIRKNRENVESEKITKVYESQIIITLENESITTPAVMGDCEILLTTEQLKEKVNQDLEAEGYEKLQNLDCVVLTRGNASNCFTLQVIKEQGEEAELIGESVIQYLCNQISAYHSGVELHIIEQKMAGEVTSKEKGPSIPLSSILIIMVSILVGIFLVYILMICDHKIVDIREANCILKAENSMIINKRNSEAVSAFFKYRKRKLGNICLIFSDSSVFERFELEHDMEMKAQLNNINGSFVEKTEGIEKWIVVKENSVTSEQLTKLKNLIDLYGEKLLYLIFVED